MAEHEPDVRPVIRSFSYGGGVQSTAALVLAATGRIDYPLFIFANVGADAEHPDTLAYIEEVAKPYAAAHGIELVEVAYKNRHGKGETLLERVDRLPKSVPIPVRMGVGGAPGNRTCTSDFKIKVIERELRRRGATKDRKAIVGLGISLDEYQRMRSAEDPRSPYQLREYPLIDLRMTRQDALNTISAAGIPTPGRSACYFCPFHSGDEWQRLARNRPDLFEKAAKLEEKMHKRGLALGRGEFYLTRHGIPLRDAYNGDQETLFEDEDGCESGYCMT